MLFDFRCATARVVTIVAGVAVIICAVVVAVDCYVFDGTVVVSWLCRVYSFCSCR